MTQAQHAQQAAELAKAEGHPPHVLVGALLHDIGDLNGLALDGGGVMMMRWPELNVTLPSPYSYLCFSP